MGKTSRHLKLGILIDDRTVRVAEMEVSGASVRILRFACAFAKSTDDDGLATALTQAIAQAHIESKTAYLAIADRTAAAELVALPQLKPADKQKVLDRHAMRILNLKENAGGCERSARATREIVKPEGKMAEHLLAAMPKQTVERYLHVAELAGIEIAAIVPFAEALHAGFAPSAPLENEADLFVHFENSFTHVLLGTEKLWFFTRDLAKTLDVSRMIAETPAEGAEIAEPPAASNDASSASFVPPLLLGEIRRTALFLEKEIALKIRGVVLSGPIRAYPGLCEELSGKLERPVRLAEEGPAAFTLGAEGAPGTIAAYAPAAGAVIAGVRKDALNLLPLALRPQTGISWARTGAWIGAAACLLGSLAFAAVIEFRLPQMEKDVEQFRNLVEKAKQGSGKGEDPAAIAARASRQAALSKLKQNRSPIPYVLDEISRSIPTTLALSSIKLFRDESRWFFRIEGKVKEKGSLDEISSFKLFMKSLRQSPLFEKVDFTPFRKDRPDPKNPDPDDQFAHFRIVGKMKGIGG